MTKIKLISSLGGAVAASLLTAPMLHAAENPFAMQKVSNAIHLAEGMEKGAEGKCGDKVKAEKMMEGKCNEGKCGDKMNNGDTNGNKEKMMEGKCNEGKCGDKMNDGDVNGNKGKMMEGKCNEGKCGDKMK